MSEQRNSSQNDISLYLRKFDSSLMNPKRFMIATLLYIFGPKSVGDIAKALSLSFGDVDNHLRRMRRDGYVELRKTPTLRGPRVLVKLTSEGVEEYEKLVDALKGFLSGVREGRLKGSESPSDLTED